MFRLALVTACSCILAGTSAAQPPVPAAAQTPVPRAAEPANHGSVGLGTGVTVPGERSNPCPPAALCLSFDGTAENGYCWQFLSGQPPFGAFAECWNPGCPACICGIELLLTSIGNPCTPCDLYVWDDAGGIPGNVLSVTHGADPCPVAIWPEVSTHDFAITPVPVCGPIWYGYWADFQQECGYLVAADLDGQGGCPMTYCVLGEGCAGWTNVSVIWGPTQSIGIGAWILPAGCGPVPTGEGSWGAIKRLYR